MYLYRQRICTYVGVVVMPGEEVVDLSGYCDVMWALPAGLLPSAPFSSSPRDAELFVYDEEG